MEFKQWLFKYSLQQGWIDHCYDAQRIATDCAPSRIERWFYNVPCVVRISKFIYPHTEVAPLTQRHITSTKQNIPSPVVYKSIANPSSLSIAFWWYIVSRWVGLIFVFIKTGYFCRSSWVRTCQRCRNVNQFCRQNEECCGNGATGALCVNGICQVGYRKGDAGTLCQVGYRLYRT